MTNAARRGPSLRALPVVLLVAAASTAVVLATLWRLPAPGDWLASVFEAGPARDRLIFTLLQATGSTVLGVALGLLASWCLSRPGLPLRWLLTMLLLAPVAVPGFAFALGLRELTGEAVRAELLVTWAHAAFALGVTAWVVTPAWGAGHPALADQAVLLGTSRWRALLAQAWRAVAGPLVLASALGFANAAVALGTVLVLGGSGTWTVEALLFAEAPQGRTEMVSTLAAVQLLLGLVAYLWAWRWPARRGRPPRPSAGVRLLGLVALLGLAALVVVPLAALVAAGVRAPGDSGMGAFGGLLGADLGGRSVATLLRWTLLYAASAGVAATALAWLAAPYVAAPRRGWWRSGLRYAPVGLLALVALLSPVVAGVGVREVAQALGADLQRTWAPVFVAQTLLAFPLALRVLTSVQRPDDARRFVEAAVLLGQAPRAAAWRWRGRFTLHAVGAALLVSMALVVGEVGAASVLAPGTATPAGVAVLRATGQGMDAPGEAAALAAVLSAAAVVAFTLGEWLRRRAWGAGATASEGR